MSDKTATFVRKLNGTGDMRLYKLDPPMVGEEGPIDYVAVSATVAFSGHETYIFPANAEDVTGWGELEGSYRGGLSHEAALSNAGYVIA